MIRCYHYFFTGLFCIMMLACTVLVREGVAQDLDEIKHNGVLRHLGIPYANFVTGSGDGMDVELVKLFAKHIGVRYEFVKTDWDDVIGDLTGTKVKSMGKGIEFLATVPIKGDLIANGMTVLSWRQRVVDFSEATFPNQVWLIARSDSPLKPIKPSGDLEKEIVAVKALIKEKSLLCKTNTCLDPALYNLEETGAKVMLFKGSLNELAPAVLNGEAEATLLDVPDALIALQKWPGRLKVIGPVSAVQDMAVAFRKDSPRLRAAFDSFLKTLRRNGTLGSIALQYYPFVTDYYADFFKKR